MRSSGSRRSSAVSASAPAAYPLGAAEVALAMLVAASALMVAWAYPVWRGHVHVVCPLLEIGGVPCPACGGTRAMAELAAGNLVSALAWNPLVAAGGLGLIIWLPWATLMLAGAVGRPLIPTTLSPAVKWSMLMLVAGNWLYLLLWFKG